MKRIISVIALLVMGCLTLTGCQKPSNTVVAPYHVTKGEMSGWHKGLPQPLKKNATWISNPKKNLTAGAPVYSRNMTELSNTHGFFSISFMFSRGGYPLDNTNSSNTNLPIYPHYKKIGKNTYHVISGLTSLKRELEANNHNDSLDYIPISNMNIKINNNNNIQIWSHGSHLDSNLDTFTRSNETINQLVHIDLENHRG